MLAERFFSRLDGDAPGTQWPKLRAFQITLALVIGTEYWTKALLHWGALELPDGIALALATPLAAVVVHGRWRRAGFAGLALLQLWYVWRYFPHTGNHRYLEAVVAALLALLDDAKETERRLSLRSLRWMVVVVLFYSGLQKLVHGYYFRGQFLSYSLWRDGFQTALGPLLAPEELERLTSYAAGVGDGPYLVFSPAFLFVSNATWAAEMIFAVLLFARPTRRFAWIAALVFVAATEVVARELMFGVEFACAIALFARGDVLRRWVWPVAGFLLLLVLMRLGVVPGVLFH